MHALPALFEPAYKTSFSSCLTGIKDDATGQFHIHVTHGTLLSLEGLGRHPYFTNKEHTTNKCNWQHLVHT